MITVKESLLTSCPSCKRLVWAAVHDWTVKCTECGTEWDVRKEVR